jgi:hypothetical protein
MPGPYFVHRNAQGAVVSAALAPSPGSEALPAGHPDLLRFFGTDGTTPDFADIDAGFVRVLEDLIDTLIQKNIIHHTDLPPEAQRKLVSRKGLRSRLQGSLNILRDDDGIL